jgi:hypothetical protein
LSIFIVHRPADLADDVGEHVEDEDALGFSAGLPVELDRFLEHQQP